jgi:hypothetical protein
MYAQALTPHTCNGGASGGQYRCANATECGDDKAGDRFVGVCDKNGCDFNPCVHPPSLVCCLSVSRWREGRGRGGRSGPPALALGTASATKSFTATAPSSRWTRPSPSLW